MAVDSRRVVLVAIVLALALTTRVFSEGREDFSFVLSSGVEVPFGSRSALTNDDQAFELGASAAVTGQYIFPNRQYLYANGTVNYQGQTTPGTAPALNIIAGGFGAGANLRMGNAMSVQVGPEAGGYVGIFGDAVGSNPFFGATTNVMWDFTPSFSLTLGAGYRYYLGTDADGAYTDLVQTARLSLGTVFRLSNDGERRRIRMDNIEFAPVFPVFYGYYDQNTLGSVEVKNEENGRITDVKVFFNVNEYMEQPKLSAEIPELGRNESADVDLNALFRSAVLDINTDTLVQSEIITEYTYLGRRFTRSEPYTLRIHGRNSMTWDDDRKAACFVNPKDPTVLLFSKNTAGLIREVSTNPINLNFKVAVGIFEALNAYGMNYVIDPDSSYIELSQNANALDTLLFPAEALTYRAGDCDDLSILYASLLESVGINTAFITIPGHIYVAFSLDLTEEEAKQEFTSIDDFIFIDDNAWVPVEITLVTEDFMRAWRTGARQWRDASSKGSARLIAIHDAWQTFEPAPTQTPPLSLVFPSREAILANYNRNMDEFVELEINERLSRYNDRIERRGDSANVRNRIGVLYARYGKYGEAREQFERATRLDSSYASPFVNLGNINYLAGNMIEANDWYTQAARLEPDSTAVIAGLARTQYELEEYDRARENYTRLAAQAPDVASEYAYIGNTLDVVGRAAAAQDRGRTIWEDEDFDE